MATEHLNLTRRERQIMDVLYAREEASVQDVVNSLPHSPNYSTVRALLRKLVDKGHVSFREDGPRYLYTPVLAKESATSNAVQRLLDTFFGGSTGAAVLSLLGRSGDSLSSEDVERIERELERLKGAGDG